MEWNLDFAHVAQLVEHVLGKSFALYAVP